MLSSRAQAVDIWSAGCVFWEILTLDFLWQRQGMMGMVVQSEPLTPNHLPDSISHDLRSIVAACLSLRGDRRPNANSLSSAILNILQGQSGALVMGDDWGSVVGGFFNQLSLGGIFSAGAPAYEVPPQIPSSVGSSAPDDLRRVGAGSVASASAGAARMSQASTLARSSPSSKQPPGRCLRVYQSKCMRLSDSLLLFVVENSQSLIRAHSFPFTSLLTHPEKRGLKWHSDMSLVDIKEITSRDLDKDFDAPLPSRRASSKLRAYAHKCADADTDANRDDEW